MMKLALILVCVVVFYSINSAESRGFCRGKRNGNYANPRNCHGYIACSNGYTHYMPCPAGLKWNDNKKRCDWPRNVHCSGHPGGCRDRLSRQSCRFLKRHSQCRRAMVRNIFCRKSCRRCY